jgi:hypothetical protein
MEGVPVVISQSLSASTCGRLRTSFLQSICENRQSGASRIDPRIYNFLLNDPPTLSDKALSEVGLWDTCATQFGYKFGKHWRWAQHRPLPKMAEAEYEQYLRSRYDYYNRETRWAAAPFWQRRSGVTLANTVTSGAR